MIPNLLGSPSAQDLITIFRAGRDLPMEVSNLTIGNEERRQSAELSVSLLLTVIMQVTLDEFVGFLASEMPSMVFEPDRSP